MILVYVETTADGVNEVSLETVTFARKLSAAGGGVPIDAVVVGPAPEGVPAQLAAYGVRTVHHADGDDFDRSPERRRRLLSPLPGRPQARWS